MIDTGIVTDGLVDRVVAKGGRPRSPAADHHARLLWTEVAFLSHLTGNRSNPQIRTSHRGLYSERYSRRQLVPTRRTREMMTARRKVGDGAVLSTTEGAIVTM